MKFSKIALLMTVIVIGLLSCKKDDEPKSVVGTWEGAWGFGTETPVNFEKWDMEKDGELISYYPDGTMYAAGTWERDGDEIEVTYTEVTAGSRYRFIGTYDEDDDEITGDWADADFPIIGGTFEMQRQ